MKYEQPVWKVSYFFQGFCRYKHNTLFWKRHSIADIYTIHPSIPQRSWCLVTLLFIGEPNQKALHSPPWVELDV